MPTNVLACPACKDHFPAELLGSATLVPCRSCGAPLQIFAFPALFRQFTPAVAEKPQVEGETVCFHHPQKKANVVCANCGRFLCGLCDVEWDGRHLCPACLESGAKKGKEKKLQNKRVLYDQLTLALSILPLLIFYFIVFTAPITLYLVFRHWNSPISLTAHSRVGSKIRLVLAAIIATLELAGAVILVVLIVRKH